MEQTTVRSILPHFSFYFFFTHTQTGTGNGVCRHGICLCFPGFMGVDCAERMTCPKNCAGHGRCTSTGKCVCSLGFSGYDCSNSETCPNKCSSRGSCLPGGVCRCIPGWEGTSCDVCRVGSRVACNAHGVCVQSKASSNFRFQQTRPIMLGSSRDGTSGARFVSGGTALMMDSQSKKSYVCKCDRNWLGDICTTNANAKPKDIDAPKEKKKEEQPGKKLDMTRVVDKYATPDYGSGEDAKPAELGGEDEEWWKNPPGSSSDEDSLTDKLRLVSHRTSVEDHVKSISEDDEKMLMNALMRGVSGNDDDDDDSDDDDEVMVKSFSSKKKNIDSRSPEIRHHKTTHIHEKTAAHHNHIDHKKKVVEKKEITTKTATCPVTCESMGHGVCYHGHCYCKQGFYKEDCSSELRDDNNESESQSTRFLVVLFGILLGVGTALVLISRGIITRYFERPKVSLKTKAARSGGELPEWVGF